MLNYDRYYVVVSISMLTGILEGRWARIDGTISNEGGGMRYEYCSVIACVVMVVAAVLVSACSC